MARVIEVDGTGYRVGPEDAIDISIPLRFDGPQPNAFGVEPAVSRPCEYGSLVGDTRRGGSCNFEQITFIPHCNGTHTECVGHITHERLSVRECLRDAFIPAVLIIMVPEEAENGDLVLTRDVLDQALNKSSKLLLQSEAVIVRTLPNGGEKLSQTYGENHIPPYFTTEAIERIVALGFRHLLVDLPSIDRLFDDGKLLNHRIFWNVAAGSAEVGSETRVGSTITEMIHVPPDVPDGQYLLNIQIAPFEADAAPSRPVLFPIERTRKPRGGAGVAVGSVSPSGRGSGTGATRSRARERS